MCQRGIKCCKGLVGLKRHAAREHDGLRQPNIIFVNIQGPGDPQIHRVGEDGVDAFEIQIARAALRKLNVAHGFQWHTNQQAQMVALGPEERLHGDIVRDVMRHREMRKQHTRRECQCCQANRKR